MPESVTVEVPGVNVPLFDQLLFAVMVEPLATKEEPEAIVRFPDVKA